MILPSECKVHLQDKRERVAVGTGVSQENLFQPTGKNTDNIVIMTK